MKIRSYVLISLMVLTCSILPIFVMTWNSISNSDLKNAEFTDFSSVIMSNCKYIDENKFVITGPDPFFIIQNINQDVNNVEIKFENQNMYGLAIYYNDGSGYNEKNSRYSAIRDDKVQFGFTNIIKIKELRVDFENLQNNSAITIYSILLNNVKTIHYNVLFITLAINILVLSNNYYLIRKLSINWKIIIVVLLCVLLYSFDYVMLSNVPRYLKVISFAFVILFDHIMILVVSEVNHDEENF